MKKFSRFLIGCIILCVCVVITSCGTRYIEDSAESKNTMDLPETDLENITEETVSNNLYTAGIPDPDLLIRTSGEIRTSNFLPWQIVYSEFLFIEKNWPDFTEHDLDEAIEVYMKRHRKFGAN